MKHPFRSMKDKFNGNTEKIDGTKLLNRAGTSKKETRSNKAHLSS
jgi:phenylalanyl-tRNA synthetase alpha subunit